MWFYKEQDTMPEVICYFHTLFGMKYDEKYGAISKR